MKAWWVDDYTARDAGGVFVWAETRGKARVDGCAEMNADEMILMRAIRVPALDDWPPNRRIPERKMLEIGWPAVCEGCRDAETYEDFGADVGSSKVLCEWCALPLWVDEGTI